MSSRGTSIVTGGAGGIGRAICRRLAQEGYSVVVIDRDGAAAEAVARELPHGEHIARAVDVSSESDVAEAFASVDEALGEVDVLVTAAGVMYFGADGLRNPVARISVDEWQQTLDVNVLGTMLFAREFAKRLTSPRPSGRVVTISSVSGQLGGFMSSSAYITSKAALFGFTKILARELAPHRVTVNCVAPGLIDAPMLRAAVTPDADERVVSAIPAGRLGTPEDIAGAVAFLVSEDAEYVTGATIDVNGGYSMR
jgi:NAD(P)-dependent dehydrogenase (short-subunit alcohol dehydrogenase family)